MPRSKISPSLINHNQGAGVKKKCLISTIGYNGILSSVISRRAYSFARSSPVVYLIFSNIFPGKYTSAALSTDNKLYEWGFNEFGQFGNGTNTNSNKPINSGILNVADLAGGALHLLALLNNNTLYSWGGNTFGQLGDGTNTSSNIPVAVDMSGLLLGKTISKLGCGTAHSIVLTSDNNLYSWGNSQYGQLGDGANTNRNIPVAVDMSGVLSGKTISQLAVGDFHCMVLTSDNKLFSWGFNVKGQLGNGTFTDSNVPVAVDMTGVLSGKTISQISCGTAHSIVLTSDNKLFSWGWNNSGQLGNGDNTFTDRNVPVVVDMSGVLLGKTISQISCGGQFSLVLTSDNNLYAWGYGGDGQLGDGNNNSLTNPIAVNMSGVLSGKTITKIVSYTSHSLVLTNDGYVYSWGLNNVGQLGDGTNTSRNVPVDVIQTI